MIAITNNYIKNNHRVRPGGSYNKVEICIHSTGNPESTAKNERAWLDNPSNQRQASWHLCIDEKDCICAIPLKEEAWHCGNNNGNKYSIGIEICESGNRQKTLERAAELVVQLMKEYNIPLSKVKRHYDYSSKSCPAILMANNWQGWKDFIKLIQNKMTTNDPYITAIDKLVSKGIINSPDIWKQETYNNDNVKSLIIKFANKC